MQGVPVVPEDFDLHDVHINVHNRERKSPAYELADPSIKEIIDLHVMAHQRMLMGDTQAALDAQAMMNQGMQPTASQAMTLSGGLSGQAAEALVGNQPGFSSNIAPAEAVAPQQMPQMAAPETPITGG
jgi:hypothetical protein